MLVLKSVVKLHVACCTTNADKNDVLDMDCLASDTLLCGNCFLLIGDELHSNKSKINLKHGPKMRTFFQPRTHPHFLRHERFARLFCSAHFPTIVLRLLSAQCKNSTKSPLHIKRHPSDKLQTTQLLRQHKRPHRSRTTQDTM